MNRGGRWLRSLVWAWACMAALGAGAAPSAAPPATLSTPPVPTDEFSLRWKVERVQISEREGERAHARFALRNQGPNTLPAQGWALYFTCIAEVVTGATDGPFVVEPVVGTLYRVRPTAAFTGLPPGGVARFGVLHHDRMRLPDRFPLAPYLVFDREPDRALVLTDYRAEPLAPRQLPPDAEARFARNAIVQPVRAQDLPPVFPPPRQFARHAGELRWLGLPRIEAPAALRAQAAQAKAWLQPRLTQPDAKAPPLRLALAKGGKGKASPEAFTLDIDPQRGVTLTGGSPAGVQYGLQALRDLIPLNPQAGVVLPALRIDDAPRFSHRGLLLDVARSFHPKDTVLRVIDLMARLRLNVLHLHLTDDEGWRLAIRDLPELTEVGGRRGHSADPLRHLPAAHGSGAAATGAPGSGHYSADDYQAILRHAAARHVEVIPEIEMPGHARAAVVAMRSRSARLAAAGHPQADAFRLDDPADRSKYHSAQRYTDHVMDPGLPSTYRFIETVVAEVVRLHRQAGVPLRTLHVGADETPAGAWTGSPAAQALIKKQGLAGTAGLWNHFYDRVHAIVRRHGVQVAGWEELGARRAKADGTGPLVPNEHFQGRGFSLYVWNNLDDSIDLAYRLANAGYRSVLAPATAYYLDMAHEPVAGEAGVAWAAFVDLDTTFDHVPLDALRQGPITPLPRTGRTALTALGRQHIAGLEATAFSEILHTRDKLEWMLFPRLLALAERAWSPDPAWAQEADAARAKALHAQDWSRFVHQLAQQVLPRLSTEFPGLNWRLAPPGLTREGGRVRGNHLLSALPGLTLRYSTDLSEPRADSPAMTEPLDTRATVRAATFTADGRRSATATLPGADRVVFLGDSITEGWLQFDAAYFADPARINRGISGQTTKEMLARFQAEVLDAKPRAVVILAGTNDIAGNSGPTTEAEIAERIARMAEQAKAAGIRVVLVSVLPAARYFWRPEVQQVGARIVELNRRLAAYAAQQGHGWVDLHTPMADAQLGLKPFYGEDGVHPNAEGYRLMRGPVEAAVQAALRP